MELKESWNSYTSKEKVKILMHWFIYYGGVYITLAEVDYFKRIANERYDEIFSHIITLFCVKNTIQSNTLIGAIRTGNMEELFNSSVKVEDLESEKEVFQNISNMLLKEIVTTYNNPEPPIPIDNKKL